MEFVVQVMEFVGSVMEVCVEVPGVSVVVGV